MILTPYPRVLGKVDHVPVWILSTSPSTGENSMGTYCISTYHVEYVPSTLFALKLCCNAYL